MCKKIYATCMLLVSFLVMLATMRYCILNKINVFKAEHLSRVLESAFPCKVLIKEIYGASNRVISPNEKIDGNVVTIKHPDGFLETISNAKTDVINKAKSKVVELNSVCKKNGTHFSYFSYPSKSNSKTMPTEYGIETNYEWARADFLSFLNQNKIDYLDVRTLLENDGFCVKDIFYKTDHHWNTSSGLYAAKAITNYMNDTYGWNLDSSLLSKDKFIFTTYKNLWFGETGRSLSRTWVNTLDDFTYIVPNYDTSITLCYPDGKRRTGDFSIMVDCSGYSGNVDYYTYSAHYSYAKGMGSPMTYHNNQVKNGKKLLIIKDSFSVVVIPFLILTNSDITVWDMRVDKTKKGLYKFIEDNAFDIVLLAYTDFWREDMWNFN